MSSIPIEQMIREDLHYFLAHLERKKRMDVEHVIELSSYIATNFMRLIYTKQKEISTEEINGVIGITSSILHEIFGDEITNKDYKKMADNTLLFLKNTDFDNKSQSYFRELSLD